MHRDGEVERYHGDVASSPAARSIRRRCCCARPVARPDGLANGSGVVGRHYMCHNNSALIAISRTPNPTRFQKTLGLNDFYDGSDDQRCRSAISRCSAKPMRRCSRARRIICCPAFAAEKLATHALDFWLTGQDLPDPDNRVLIDRDGGIRLHYPPNNLGPHEGLTRKLRHLLNHIGCEPHLLPQNAYFGKSIPIAGTGHQNGTIRFGDDRAPRRST